MIHSLAGGVIKDNTPQDIAKVRMENGDIRWYLCDGLDAKGGDKVLVPSSASVHGEVGEVMRVDKNVSPQVSPIPIKRMKAIIKVIK